MLRLLQVSEQVFAQVSQRYTCGHTIAYQVTGNSGEERLSTVSSRAQASTAVYRAPIVVALSEVGLSSIQSHSHSQRCGYGPGLGMEGLLRCSSSSHCICSPCEDGKAAVPFATRPYDATCMPVNYLFDY